MNRVVQEDMEFIAIAPLPWSDFAGTTVLLTGANGLLCGYMVEALLFLNDRFHLDLKVIAVVRNREKALRRFSVLMERLDFTLLVQDVCYPLQVESDIDYIVHAASQASPKYYSSDPAGTIGANILGTFHLLELARSKNVLSFLYFSSGEVYGRIPDDQLLTTETDYGYIDPTVATSCYGESKRMGENMCVSWHHQYGVPVRIVRPFHTYGPGIDLEDGRVFADFVSDIVHGRDIVLRSNGSAARAFCYLADAVVAFFLLLLCGRNGQAYNVGTDEPTTIQGLAERLVGLFPERNLKVVKKIGDSERTEKRGIFPDISKIRELGWEPSFSLEEGFRRTIRSFL